MGGFNVDKNQLKRLVRKIDGEVMLDTSMWGGDLKTADELTTEEVRFVLGVLYSYQKGYWEISEKMNELHKEVI